MPTTTSFACRAAHASLLSSVLLASLVVRSTAFRSRVSEEAFHNMIAESHTHEWQKKTYLFCLNTEQVIECDGENEKMEVSTAMYNRNQKLRKEVCGAELGSKWRSCDVDAKELVTYRCEGTQKCHLIPSDHAHCKDDPLYQMRLVIKCSAGEPRPEPPRGNCPHEQDHPCNGGMAPTTTTEPDPAKLAGYAADLPQSIQQYLPDAAKKLLDAPKSTTTEEPVVIEDVAEMKVVKDQVTKEIEDPSLEGISLVPCYRFARTQKLRMGDFYGNHLDIQILHHLRQVQHLQHLRHLHHLRHLRHLRQLHHLRHRHRIHRLHHLPVRVAPFLGEAALQYHLRELGRLRHLRHLSRLRYFRHLVWLTNCGKNEGCFHLTFPDGSAYTDQNVPPTAEELAQGDLTKAKDSLWVTFRGTGLKRNDYGTWGVCLPKTSELQLAVTLWNAMRKGQAAGKLLD